MVIACNRRADSWSLRHCYAVSQRLSVTAGEQQAGSLASAELQGGLGGVGPVWWEVCAFLRAHPQCNLPLHKFWKNIQTEASHIICPKFVLNSWWEEEEQKESCSGTNNIIMELILHCQISCPGMAPFAAFVLTKFPKAQRLAVCFLGSSYCFLLAYVKIM